MVVTCRWEVSEFVESCIVRSEDELGDGFETLWD